MRLRQGSERLILICAMQKAGSKAFNGTYHIVETYGPALKEDLSGPAGVYGVPKFNYIQANVLVKAVEY